MSRDSSTEAPQALVEDPEKQSQKKVFIESDAGDGTKREDQYLHGIHLVFCFIAVCLSLFLEALDQTIVATILTTVGNKFDDFDKVGWLASGFLLAMAVCIQPFGKFSIIFGRKYTMVTAIVLFEAGSLMCALAKNMNVLIGGRVLAGIGAAGIQGMVFVIVTEVVPIEKRPIGMAIVSCIFAVASVLGPLIGGAFTSHVSWRWAFYINLPIGGIALAFLLWAFNPPKCTSSIVEELKTFDYFGTFLLISGCVVFLLALTFGGNDFSWHSAAVILCFVLGGLLLIAFIIWNGWFSKNQIIAVELIKIPQVVASIFAISGIFAAFILSMVFLPIYFQVIHGASAMGAGLHLLPMIVAVVLSSICSGVAIQKSKYVKPFSLVAGILGPIGFGLLAILGVDTLFSAQVGLLIIGGVAVGAQMQPAIVSAQISAPKTPGSTIMVTVLLNFSRSLVSALAADLGDVIYASSFKNYFKKAFKATTNTTILSDLQDVDISQLVSNTSLLAHLNPVTQHFVKTQIAKALRNVFYMGIGLAAITFVACFFITNKKLPEMSDGAANAAEKEKEEKTELTSDSNDIQSEAVHEIAEGADFEKKSIQASGDESSTSITRK
ncbi:hypothetical protein G9P44_004661 [Scheffersomyces stipitis]|nr:hypothetical protein G9P44_004661 [Scheffersomyces stipitis]